MSLLATKKRFKKSYGWFVLIISNVLIKIYDFLRVFISSVNSSIITKITYEVPQMQMFLRIYILIVYTYSNFKYFHRKTKMIREGILNTSISSGDLKTVQLLFSLIY